MEIFLMTISDTIMIYRIYIVYEWFNNFKLRNG